MGEKRNKRSTSEEGQIRPSGRDKGKVMEEWLDYWRVSCIYEALAIVVATRNQGRKIVKICAFLSGCKRVFVRGDGHRIPKVFFRNHLGLTSSTINN